MIWDRYAVGWRVAWMENQNTMKVWGTVTHASKYFLTVQPDGGYPKRRVARHMVAWAIGPEASNEMDTERVGL